MKTMKLLSVLCVAVMSAVFLSGCAETELAAHLWKNSLPQGETYAGQRSQIGNFKVGKPYQIGGQWYTPRETYDHSETGIASWYGPGFHGNKTASGERFNARELTAAHRTLQMPSLVRVTNLDNGRAVVVRINDRGPFARGRVIDVSERAAELLGFKSRGTAKVRIDVLTEESRAIALAAQRGESTRGVEVAINQRGGSAPLTRVAGTAQTIPGHITDGQFYPDPVVTQEAVRPTGIFIQAGAFSKKSSAEAVAGQLRRFGNAAAYPADVGGRHLFRARLGPFQNVSDADAALARVVSAGYAQAMIVVE